MLQWGDLIKALLFKFYSIWLSLFGEILVGKMMSILSTTTRKEKRRKEKKRKTYLPFDRASSPIGESRLKDRFNR